MIDSSQMAALMDSLTQPVTFVDVNHVIRYMNRAAVEQYAKRGGAGLIGQSLLDCHNEESCRKIRLIREEMATGLEERMISDTPERRVYMRAVRGGDGELLGYFERFEYPMEW